MNVEIDWVLLYVPSSANVDRVADQTSLQGKNWSVLNVSEELVNSRWECHICWAINAAGRDVEHTAPQTLGEVIIG
jgi:hypothetical protein